MQAEQDGTPVFKFARWRKKGEVLPEVLEQYKKVFIRFPILPLEYDYFDIHDCRIVHFNLNFNEFASLLYINYTTIEYFSGTFIYFYIFISMFALVIKSKS